MSTPRQGEIWWGESDDKRRPLLVVTRSDAIGRMNGVVVAPVTRSVRGIRTEIPLGPDEGLSTPCVASFDNLQRLPRHMLTERVGDLGWRLGEICEALRALADC